MNRQRLVGIVLSGIAFTLAGVAGVWLALQLSGGRAFGEVIGSAALALVPITLLVAGGIYLYVRSEQQEEEDNALPLLQIQRDLMTILRERGTVEVAEVAGQFNVAPEVIREVVDQLVALDLFNGYAHWERGVLQLLTRDQVMDIDRCAVCGSTIDALGRVTICATCSAEYYLATEAP